jgi:hypothetical protein
LKRDEAVLSPRRDVTPDQIPAEFEVLCGHLSGAAERAGCILDAFMDVFIHST